MDWKTIPIQFNNGINQKSDDKQVVPGTWLTLENLVMDKTGRFNKRRGFSATDRSANANCRALYLDRPSGTVNGLTNQYQDNPLRCDDFISFGHPSAQATRKNNTCVVMGSDPIAIYAELSYPTGFTGTLSVGGTTYSIDIFGARISQWCGTPKAFVGALYESGSGVNAKIVISNEGRSSPQVVDTNVYAKNIAAFSDSTYLYVVYSDLTALNTKAFRFNFTSNTVDYFITLNGNNLPNAISSNGTDVFIGIGPKIYKADAQLSGATLQRTASAGNVSSITPDGVAVIKNGDDSIILSRRFGTEYPLPGFIPASCLPFTINGRSYAVFTQSQPADVETWPGGFVIKRIDQNPYIVGQANDYLSDFGSVLEGGMLYTAAAVFSSVSQPNGGSVPIVTAGNVIIAKFIESYETTTAFVNSDLIYSTSSLRLATGSKGLFGWHYVPTVVSAVATATAAPSLPVGDYKFLAVAVERTEGGNTLRSVPGPILSYTQALAKSVNVTIKMPIPEASKVATSKIELYAQFPGETIFERLQTLPLLASQTFEVYSKISPSLALYTTGGIVEDLPPPAIVGGVSQVKDRIWILSAEKNEAKFSDQFFSGESPMFSEFFALALPYDGTGGQTSVEIDGKILVFQKYQVSATFGDGPDATGQNNFPALQVVARDIGAIVAKSVVTTNEGVYFLSSKGLWVVDRSLTLAFIGTPIDDDASAIVCGRKLEDSEQLWFFTNTKALIFDCFHKIWTTAPLTLSGSVYDSLVANGSAYVLHSGAISKLDTSTTDRGGTITVKAKTGWISMAGIKGFERIRRIMFLCDQVSSTTMTVKLRYNFVDTVAETFTVTSASIVDAGNNVQWLIRPRIQKCECFQIEFDTSSAGGTLDISSIALELGGKSGLFRVGATKKIKGV